MRSNTDMMNDALSDEISAEGLPPSVRVYNYEGMDDFSQIMDCHITRLYASLGTFSLQRGDFKWAGCNDDDGDGDYGAIPHLDPHEEDAGDRPCQHSQPLNNRTCQQSSDGSQHNRESLQYEPGSQYIIFIVDPRSFETDFLCRETIRHTRLSYNPFTHILIAKMPVPAHESASREFDFIMQSSMEDAGLRKRLGSWGGATMTAPDGTTKEADGAWGPFRPPPGSPKTPSVVLEVGYSDSPAKTRRSSHWWLDPARYEANVAIGMNLNVKKPEIIIDTWEWDPTTCRPKTTNHMVIKRSSRNINFEPNVHDPTIMIPFHQIFRRPRQSNEDKDIVIRTQDLIEFAYRVWEIQFDEMD
jgi:hypothetical protein